MSTKRTELERMKDELYGNYTFEEICRAMEFLDEIINRLWLNSLTVHNGHFPMLISNMETPKQYSDWKFFEQKYKQKNSN